MSGNLQLGAACCLLRLRAGAASWCWIALVLAACTPQGADVTAYVGATVFDGTGAVVPNAVILESSGHVTAVGSRDSIEIPRGATQVPSWKIEAARTALAPPIGA